LNPLAGLSPLDAALSIALVVIGLYFLWQLRDNWLIALEMRAYAASRPLIQFLVEYSALVMHNAIKTTLWAVLGFQTIVFYGSQLLGIDPPIRLLPQPLPLLVIVVGAFLATRANRGTIRYVRSLRLRREGEP
jgi:hypothetical protein